MGKKFYVGAAKRFPSRSVGYVSHIARKEENSNHHFLNDHRDNNDHKSVSGYFSVSYLKALTLIL